MISVKNLGGGGSGKIIISPTAPEDTKALWIDTSNASGDIGGILKYYNFDSNAWVTVSAVWG